MSKHRDIFYSEIERGLIGPGSDTFGVDDKEELISDYPLNRYYSGILFPVKEFSSETTIPTTEEEKEDSENIANTSEEDYPNSIEEQIISEDNEEKQGQPKEDKEDYS